MLHVHSRLEKLLFEGPDFPLAKAWNPVLRVLCYVYALLRDLWRGELNLRAMSLVYTTLLSIVPLLAFAFSIFKGLGIHRDLEPIIYEFFRPVGENATELTERVMTFVDNIRSGVLGTLGLAFLLYSVISMIQKIEESMNFVWRVDRPRSFARRISEYLSLLVIGPIVVVAGFGLTASAASSTVMHKIAQYQPFGAILAMGGRVVSYLVVSAFFTFLYMFIPNTRVRIIPALVGGLTAGLLWIAVGALFSAIVVYATSWALVYSSFAILISALIWIYTAWLILLIGAQLSFYVQNTQYMRRGQEEFQLSGSLAEQLALNVMYLIGRSYRAGEPGWTTNMLASRLSVPGAPLGKVLRKLEAAGLLLATEKERFIPGRDMSEIDLSQIVDAARRPHHDEPPLTIRGAPEAEELVTMVEVALHEKLQGKTLREVVETSR